MTGFFERSEGNKSMMRLLALLGLILGAMVVLWGMILITITTKVVLEGNEIIPGMFGNLIAIVTGGLGLAGGGEVLKMLQQRGEVKEVKNGTTIVQEGK